MNNPEMKPTQHRSWTKSTIFLTSLTGTEGVLSTAAVHQVCHKTASVHSLFSYLFIDISMKKACRVSIQVFKAGFLWKSEIVTENQWSLHAPLKQLGEDFDFACISTKGALCSLNPSLHSMPLSICCFVLLQGRDGLNGGRGRRGLAGPAVRPPSTHICCC